MQVQFHNVIGHQTVASNDTTRPTNAQLETLLLEAYHLPQARTKFSFSNQEILPILLQWGGKRHFIADEKINVHLSDELINKYLDTLNFRINLYRAIGSHYNIHIEIREKERTDRLGNSLKKVRIEKRVGFVRKKNNSRDKQIGLNYHYPNCCIDFYIENEEQLPNKIYQNKLSEAYGEDVFFMKELAYILHTPCSLKCKDTLKNAQRYQRFVRKNFPTIATKLEQNRSNFGLIRSNSEAKELNM